MGGNQNRKLKGGVCKEVLQQEEGVTKKRQIRRRPNYEKPLKKGQPYIQVV